MSDTPKPTCLFVVRDHAWSAVKVYGVRGPDGTGKPCSNHETLFLTYSYSEWTWKRADMFQPLSA